MDILDFWAACLEEDRLWAQQASRSHERYLATGVHWQWADGDTDEVIELDPFTMDQVGSGCLASAEKFPLEYVGGLGPIFAILSAEEVPVAVAGHIVRNDPATALLRIESEERLLTMCRDGSLGERARDVALTVVQRYREHPHFSDEWDISLKV